MSLAAAPRRGNSAAFPGRRLGRRAEAGRVAGNRGRSPGRAVVAGPNRRAISRRRGAGRRISRAARHERLSLDRRSHRRNEILCARGVPLYGTLVGVEYQGRERIGVIQMAALLRVRLRRPRGRGRGPVGDAGRRLCGPGLDARHSGRRTGVHMTDCDSRRHGRQDAFRRLRKACKIAAPGVIATATCSWPREGPR